MKLALVENSKAKFVENVELPWEDVVVALTTYEGNTKDGQGFIPAVFVPCPDKCKAHGKDCGGNKYHRLADNVTHMTGLGVDIDETTPEITRQHIDRLKSHGITFVWYETFSGNGRVRLLIPFSEPLEVTRSSWLSTWDKLMKHFGFSSDTDAACKDPGRLYYSPRKPDGEERASGSHQGAFFDPKPFAAAPRRIEILGPVEPIKPAPEGVTVDTGAMRERFGRITREEVKRILAGRAPADPPSKRTEGPARYAAWRSATATLSMAFQNGDSEDFVMQLLRTAWHDEVKDSPDDHTAWETVEKLWEDALSSAAYKKAEKEAEAKANLEAFRISLDAAPALAPPADENWTKKLKMVLRKDEHGNSVPQVANARENVQIILENHPAWRGAFRYNELSKTLEIGKCPINSRMQPFEREHEPILLDWMHSEYKIVCSGNEVFSRALAIGKKNSYNPIVDFITQATWDGKPRVDSFFTDTLKCTDNPVYLKAVARFFIGAVARVLDPGCQMDYALILQAGQGLGKSTLVRILSGGYCSSEQIDIHTVTSAMLMTSSFIVEMAEITEMKKHELESVKNFITKREERFRAPYDRQLKTLPRCAVLMGTTNAKEFLNDPTGARRFLVVTPTVIPLKEIEETVPQLWAEAVYRFRSGEKWHLSNDEAELQVSENESRTMHDPTDTMILDYFLAMRPQDRPLEVTTSKITTDVFKDNINRANATRIGISLNRLGFTNAQRMRAGIRERVYRTPFSILSASKYVEPTGRLQVVQSEIAEDIYNSDTSN